MACTPCGAQSLESSLEALAKRRSGNVRTMALENRPQRLYVCGPQRPEDLQRGGLQVARDGDFLRAPSAVLSQPIDRGLFAAPSMPLPKRPALVRRDPENPGDGVTVGV